VQQLDGLGQQHVQLRAPEPALGVPLDAPSLHENGTVERHAGETVFRLLLDMRRPVGDAEDPGHDLVTLPPGEDGLISGYCAESGGTVPDSLSGQGSLTPSGRFAVRGG
jgi:hypothetical protein